MIFEILAEKKLGDEKRFFYDNQTNALHCEDGSQYRYPDMQKSCGHTARNANQGFDEHHPLTKSRHVRVVKIQLGLSCNYACDYCSQKSVERPKETNAKDIERFMQMFGGLEFSQEKGLKVEFWGGEPLVYWKTLKPLAHAIAQKFEDWSIKPQFSIITNGSLLTPDICAWLYAMGFSVSISHDGPGQPVRGPDPFEDGAKKAIVLGLYRMLRPLGRISFNAMLNGSNISRKAIYDWFVTFTGDPSVPLGEGSIVDAYDGDGLAQSLQTKAAHFEFRRTAFNDIYASAGQIGFGGILQKIDQFTGDVLSQRNARTVGQKCGMDQEDVISFDLRGNVITCQNVSAIDQSPSGISHLGGSIETIEQVQIKTATHWSKRAHCNDCPVLHICKGSCMFLSGKYWQASCDNAYSDAIALFALAFEKVTGYIPKMIYGDHLPKERQDIWGTCLEHKEKSKKVIPIHIATEAPVMKEIDGTNETNSVFEKTTVKENV